MVGFSRGAIDAIEYLQGCDDRVDVLVLISPAFFEDRDEAFKQSQLEVFAKDKNAYAKAFYRNIASPSRLDLSAYKKDEGIEALMRLLYYRYDSTQLQKIRDSGTHIEVHLGGRDRIIHSDVAGKYFEQFATVYYYKERGHLLNG